MSKENTTNIIKQEFVKLVPKAALSCVLLAVIAYGYYSSLSVLPASPDRIKSRAMQSNFIHASMTKVDHDPNHTEICHVYGLSVDASSCDNVEPFWGWCIYPKMPGPC